MWSGRRLIRDVSQVTNRAVFWTGVSAGLAVTLFTWLLRELGWAALNLERLIGSFVTGDWNRSHTWWVGFALHLALSGAIAFGYAFIFRSARRSGAGIGLNLALFHWVISGLLVGLLPAFHPLVDEVVSSPGLFMAKAGLSASLGFFFLHLVYGSVVGTLFDRAALRSEYARPIAA